eukprot:9501388-Pyramimonas_sp.AAC.1
MPGERRSAPGASPDAEPSAVASCSDPGSRAAPRCTVQTPAMPTAAMRRTQARPEADLGAA